MNDKTSLRSINFMETDLLEQFLSKAGDSSRTFRYFSKRPLQIIKNHLVTYILCEGSHPVGYGHLDQEDEKVWLGIALLPEYKGKGYGNLLMETLIDHAKSKKKGIIHLSVDNDNQPAINLYKKFGFVRYMEMEDLLFYKLVL